MHFALLQSLVSVPDKCYFLTRFLGYYRTEEDEKAIGAVYCEKMEELLQKSDFVMIVVSLSSQTHKLIGTKELAMMKPLSVPSLTSAEVKYLPCI